MPLLRRTALRAQGAGWPLYVTLPPEGQAHPRAAALEGLPVVRVPVADAPEGMNASLRAGLAALPADTQAVMVVLADMPDLTVDDFKTVAEAVDLGSNFRIWRAVTESGQPGHPIVFHADLIPALMALRGDVGGNAVVAAHTPVTWHVPLTGNHARTDLDTPQAWARWRARDGAT